MGDYHEEEPKEGGPQMIPGERLLRCEAEGDAARQHKYSCEAQKKTFVTRRTRRGQQHDQLSEAGFAYHLRRGSARRGAPDVPLFQAESCQEQ